MTNEHPARRGRRWGGIFKDLVLTVAALLGVLAIGWLVYSHQTGATVVVLKTGSMAPDLPQGSGLISRPVAATDLQVGDVVTVRLDDASALVTHRIIKIDSVADKPQWRSLTLQGDDNDTPDLFPYEVDGAMRMAYGVPNGGYALAVLKTPIFLGGVVLMVGVLVMWACWPPPLAEIEAELAERSKHRKNNGMTT